MTKLVDLTGKRFGRLIVLKRAENNKHYRSTWLCRCDCGVEKTIIGQSLTRARIPTRSCGCMSRERLAIMNFRPEGQSSFNKLLRDYKRRSKEKGREFNLTEEEFRDITSKECFYCGEKPYRISKNGYNSNGHYAFNGLDRVDSSEGYTKENVVACCWFCNRAKADLSNKDFFDLIERIYNHSFNKIA